MTKHKYTAVKTELPDMLRVHIDGKPSRWAIDNDDGQWHLVHNNIGGSIRKDVDLARILDNPEKLSAKLEQMIEGIKTVYDLDADKFYAVAKVFKDLHKKRPDDTVSMMHGRCNPCGTISCMAGWYSIGKGLFNPDYSFTVGANQLAQDLGFIKSLSFANNYMEDFFCKNPDIWGNKHASSMFSSCLSYGVKRREDLNFVVLGKFFDAIADRIKAVKQVTQNA